MGLSASADTMQGTGTTGTPVETSAKTTNPGDSSANAGAASTDNGDSKATVNQPSAQSEEPDGASTTNTDNNATKGPDSTTSTTDKTTGNAAQNQGEQWNAVASQAKQDASGIYTPQSEYNYTFGALSMNIDPLGNATVQAGKDIPFSMTSYLAGANSLSRYRIRIQLDSRMADDVQSITIPTVGAGSAVITFTRLKDANNNYTNVWEAPYIANAGKGVFPGASNLASYIGEGGKITLKDTVANYYASHSDFNTDPLKFNVYAYDDENHKALLGASDQGYIAGPDSNLSSLKKSDQYKALSAKQSFFDGSASQVTYDPTIGEHGAFVVTYQFQKRGAWTYDALAHNAVHTFNYQVDPALLPYLAKNADGTYDSEIDVINGAGGLMGIYGNSNVTAAKNKDAQGNIIQQPYNSANKVDNLTFNADGSGQINVTQKINGKNPVNFQNALAVPGFVRLVYRLNQTPDQIFKDTGAKSYNFNNYFADNKGAYQPYSLATGNVNISDSDGDLRPDITENANHTNPMVSEPDLSNAYVSENKLHGQLVFNNSEENPQIVTVTDADGNTLGTTTVTPEKFSGIAKEQKFDVSLNREVKKGEKLTVSVQGASVTAKNIELNSQPQTNTVIVKTGITAKDSTVNVSSLPALNATGDVSDAQKLITIPEDNAKLNSADAKYYWTNGKKDENGQYVQVEAPKFDADGNATGMIAVSFPDAYDKTYAHNLIATNADGTTTLNFHKTDEQTLADQYTPDGGTISVAENHTLDGTDAANGITNKDKLVDKDGNSVVKTDGYTWKVTPDTTTPGDKAGVVTVTYTDGSTDDVPVVVHVQSQAETNDPQGQDINVNKGETPDPEQGISNKDQMPKGTGYHWPDGQTPDTSKPGKVPATVIVTYPDGSKDVVPTTIIVKDPSATPSTDKTDADKNDPKGQSVDTTLGNVPDAEKAISNTGDLPKGTKYDWSQTPNVYSKGEHPGVVKVSYPDGSVDYVPASVNVTNEPTGKTVTTPKGTVPKADTTIDWGNGTEPDGTTVEWQTEPDVSTPGTHPGTVKITYPDGENTTVPVNVVVPDDSSTADKDFNPYGTTIDVPYGHKMDSDDAQKAIAGGVPTDAKNVSYDWATSVDTTKPGLTQAYVKVTATIDGKTQTKTVPVYVKVGTQAENYNPEGQNLTVKKGDAVPDAKTAISNISSLPDGTKYTWAITPDTSTVGTQSVLVKVTYPDNSVDYVPVNVTVKDNLSDADKYQPEYAPVSVEPGNTATAKPTWSTENGNEGEPTGETFAAVTKGDNPTPDWASVAPDGTVTLNPKKTQTPDDYLIPVTVTYADGTSEVVNVPVVVKGATQDNNKTTYYGDQSTVTYTLGEYTTHKTSDGSADVTAPSIVEIEFKNQDHSWKTINSVTYKLQGDKYVATTPITDANGNPIELQNGNKAPESFAASDITTAWANNFTPNTNVDNFKDSGTGTSTANSQYTNPDGEQRTDKTDPTGLVGNSKARVNITLSGQAQSYFGGASWCNAFGNIYGATTGEDLTFKQNQDISNLTQDQYRHLIDVTDLGAAGWNGQNINPNAPQVLAYVEGTDANKQFTMTWAPDGQPSTSTVANGVKGVVRIIFNDGTYLDVPAAINVIADPDSGKTDQEKTEFSQKIIYTYNGKEVATTSINNIKKGSDVSADTLKSTIDGNVPSNYTIADGYTYPAGLTNVTATPDTIEVPLTLKSGENFDMAGKLVYQTQDGKSVNDGKSDVDIKSNKGDTLTAALLHDLADKNLPSGYEIVTYPGSYNVESDGFTIPVIVKKSSTKVNYDPTDKHMNRDVVRTITIYKTDGTTQTVTQDVHFVRGGEGQIAETIDPDGNIKWTDWTVATKDGDTWKSNGAKATTGAWDEYDVDQVNGYTSTVDGNDATKVEANNNITPDTPNANVTVAYTMITNPDDHNIDPTNPGENSDMFAHPTRTINVTDPTTGAINTTKQTVWFGRTKTVSTNPNAYGKGKNTKYGDWELGKVVDGHFVIDANANSAWPEFDAPTFDGYTPSQAKVDAQTVEATTGDTEVNITYTKTDNGNHDNGGNTTPTTGDNGDHNNGNGEGNGNGNGITNNNGGVKNTNNGANNNANNNKHALPQTGNDQSAAVAGLGLAGLTTMLGLAGLKKRKND